MAEKRTTRSVVGVSEFRQGIVELSGDGLITVRTREDADESGRREFTLRLRLPGNGYDMAVTYDVQSTDPRDEARALAAMIRMLVEDSEKGAGE